MTRFIKFVRIFYIPIVLVLFSAYLGSPPETAAAEVVIGDNPALAPHNPPPARPPQQGPTDNNIWQDVDEVGLQSLGQRDIVPTKFRLVAADINALDALLAQAPQEATGGISVQSTPLILTLPMPDGSFQRFSVEEYQMVKPSHPDLKTYRAYGLDDSAAIGNLDRTPAGFHGMIFSNGEAIIINPYSQNDVVHYISYYKKDQTAVDSCIISILREVAFANVIKSAAIDVDLNSTPIEKLSATFKIVAVMEA